MIFLTTPGSGDLLNFVKSAAQPSKNQALQHIGFKMTAGKLKKMEKTLKQHGVKIDGRRGREAFILLIQTATKSNTTATESHRGSKKSSGDDQLSLP